MANQLSGKAEHRVNGTQSNHKLTRIVSLQQLHFAIELYSAYM